MEINEFILLLVLNMLYILAMTIIWYLMNDQLIDERKKNEQFNLIYDILPLTLKSKRKEIDKILLYKKLVYEWND